MAIIYKVVNKVNQKVYIGKTERSLEERKKEHLRKLNDGFYFHRAIKKYGEENFIWEILEECPDEIANDREIYWISFYDSYEDKTKGYNMTPGGEGYRLSQEIKDKISKANSGKKRTEEQKQHLSEIRKALNFHHTEEAKKKMSEQRKGRKLNLSEEEHKRRQAPKSEEFKQLMREKMLGRQFSEETKRKMSEASKEHFQLYCSNGMIFTTWEEVYNYLIQNNLSKASQISVCRTTIKKSLNNLDSYCYGLKWKTSPFLEGEEKILPKKCSEKTKAKISEQNSNKNEEIDCFNDNYDVIETFDSRREAYDWCIKERIISQDTIYGKFSGKIGEASKKWIKYKGYYWNIKQKDVETI